MARQQRYVLPDPLAYDKAVGQRRYNRGLELINDQRERQAEMQRKQDEMGITDLALEQARLQAINAMGEQGVQITMRNNRLARPYIERGIQGDQDALFKGIEILRQDPYMADEAGVLEQYATAGSRAYGNPQIPALLMKGMDDFEQMFAEQGDLTRQNVQSTFVSNGELMYLRRDGTVGKTGMQPDKDFKIITAPDGSSRAVFTGGPMQGQQIDLIPPEEAQDLARSGAQAREQGTQAAQIENIPVRGEQERLQEDISLAREAVDGIPILRRGIELLDTIETGGLDAAALRARRFFGVEGADEGELSNSLAKAVLGQLRQTFGAQFTEREGRLLMDIEAGFDKSPANNRRLLRRALIVAEDAVNRGIKAAQDSRNWRDAEDLEERMSMDIGALLEESETGVQQDRAAQLRARYGM